MKSALSENAKQAESHVSSYEISGGTQSSLVAEPHIIAKNQGGSSLINKLLK